VSKLDTDVDRIPKASDLGYVSGSYCTATHYSGEFSIFDGPMALLSNGRIIKALDEDSYIKDIEEHR
jgi:hypothetical protein